MHRLFPLAVFWLLLSAGSGMSAQTNQSKNPNGKPERAVVLIHGFKDSASKMQKMARVLRGQGWTVYTPTLAPSFGQAGLDELAGQLATFIDATFRPDEKFDLVGFSMGGLICRYYLQRMGGMPRVERLVTLGTPHHGSLWACLVPNTGCRQMRPGSDFLNDLNGDIGTLNKIRFSSIWTPLDLMILPAVSSQTGIGHEVKLWLPIHPALVWSQHSIKAVADLLRK
jgi:triacylglycerol lipase